MKQHFAVTNLPHKNHLIKRADFQRGWYSHITIPSKQADQEHQSSLLITSALYDHIISQDEDYRYDIIAKQLESKATVRQQIKEENSKDSHYLTALLSDSLRRSVNLATEKD